MWCKKLRLSFLSEIFLFVSHLGKIEVNFHFKNIIIPNRTNKELTDNLLPLWTGRRLTRLETLELINEVEGSSDKGRLFKNGNKNTLLLKTKLHDNFSFLIIGKNFMEHRLNEIKNKNIIRSNLV